MSLILSQRNTPAIFGAGQIDEIETSVLTRIARQQAGSPSGVSGRVAGKFGWRGQTNRLSDFIRGACANELGLQNGRHHQAADPQKVNAVVTEDELKESECQKLVNFVAALPAPRRIMPRDPQSRAAAQNGLGLFHSIGCGECHVQNMGRLSDLFSDLLLHDMGPALADPVAAKPETRLVGQQTLSSIGYFGGGTIDIFEEIPSNVRQEWKTPPLWGCAVSAPYLHDGRADTLHDAIMAHGGEAMQSRSRYVSLDQRARAGILAFLQTLRGPNGRWPEPMLGTAGHADGSEGTDAAQNGVDHREIRHRDSGSGDGTTPEAHCRGGNVESR